MQTKQTEASNTGVTWKGEAWTDGRLEKRRENINDWNRKWNEIKTTTRG